jgi:hypothetical protein
MPRSARGRWSIYVVAGLLVLIAVQPRWAAADTGGAPDAQELSLITGTAEEGFALAISLSRKGVTATQTDKDVLHALRPGYAHDAESLIAISHVIAVHFQTVATANNYWR